MCGIVRTRITKAVTPQQNDWPLMVQKVFALFTLQFILKKGEPAEPEEKWVGFCSGRCVVPELCYVSKKADNLIG